VESVVLNAEARRFGDYAEVHESLMQRWIEETKPIFGWAIRGVYVRVESVVLNAEARRFGDYAEFPESTRADCRRRS
jgi:tRNA isopentenyl-2-thiomethyl-A-37 hydroxylase MiaE